LSLRSGFSSGLRSVQLLQRLNVITGEFAAFVLFRHHGAEVFERLLPRALVWWWPDWAFSISRLSSEYGELFRITQLAGLYPACLTSIFASMVMMVPWLWATTLITSFSVTGSSRI
jgi:hypothetical protein